MVDRLLSARDAEKRLGIPASTIRTWAQRHRATGLYSVGLDSYRRPLYRETDLIRLRRGQRIRHPDGEHLA